MNNLTGIETDRFHELEDFAIEQLLENSSFSPIEWLEDDDKKDYRKLYKKSFGWCPEDGLKKCKHL